MHNQTSTHRGDRGHYYEDKDGLHGKQGCLDAGAEVHLKPDAH